MQVEIIVAHICEVRLAETAPGFLIRFVRRAGCPVDLPFFKGGRVAFLPCEPLPEGGDTIKVDRDCALHLVDVNGVATVIRVGA